ncbi:putative metal-dependent hydrolase [Streptomyces venezuelae]|uniref:M48 family metallopeptidase n=1 Tax=Streptomyces gardneri TaxID=66892 RepID=UPI0006BD9BC8|nr:SprT family zinc-dependent metalloprotease [Streptomyces gardneri]ALO08570.1 putative metal-dependent hydrolase [Streptomyces venezuelae]QPK45773.1 M48 family metallopeptidase [Streptomyces gardneri]WRK37120.1 SprT family zinc-dependent metalloprotease [Streptomyces venezuelae]CUM41060.1 Putative predicted metal-dependent hydrolase [Streptomyces venezuelae]
MTALADDRISQALAEGSLLTVDGLDLRVKVSGRRKRFALTVESDAGLTLHAPAGRPAREAEEFVRAHRTWVVTKLAVRERTLPLTPAKRLVDGEVFRYLGRTYRLAVVDDEADGSRVRLIAGRLVMSREQAEAPDRARAALVDWYCRAGQNWAVGRLQPWAARMGVAEPELDVCDLGRRWGRYRPGQSEYGPGRMSLGWPLFQLPMHLVDYVVAHELAHVRVPGHRADFWRLLGQALPEYAERRAELDELGRRMWMGEIA